MMKTILIITFVFCLEACGVKGSPRPPELPPGIGRGLIKESESNGVQIEEPQSNSPPLNFKKPPSEGKFNP